MKLKKAELKELFKEIRYQIFASSEYNFKVEYTPEDFKWIEEVVTARISKKDKYIPFYTIVISYMDNKGSWINREFEYYYSKGGEVLEKKTIFKV